MLPDNSRPDVGVVQRLDSPIIGLKNFNNWVKSVLITRFAHPVLAASRGRSMNGNYGYRGGRGREGNTGAGKVLDMGCGKGGDMTKWAKAKVRELIGVGTSALHICCFCYPNSSLSGTQILPQFQLIKHVQGGSHYAVQNTRHHLLRSIVIPNL
jgi:hypothetical protein